MKKIWILIILLIGIGFSNHGQTAKHIPSPKVPAQLTLNKMLYEKYCAECHGVDLRGSDKGPPFMHRVYHPGHHGDRSFYVAVKKGAKAHHWKFGDMKPIEGIDDRVIGSIVKYVRYVQKAAGLF